MRVLVSWCHWFISSVGLSWGIAWVGDVAGVQRGRRGVREPVSGRRAGLRLMLLLLSELWESFNLCSSSSVIVKGLWALPGTWYQLSCTQITDFLPKPGCSVIRDLFSFLPLIGYCNCVVLLQCGFMKQIVWRSDVLEGGGNYGASLGPEVFGSWCQCMDFV